MTIGRYDNSKFVIISLIDNAPMLIDISQDKWINAPETNTCVIFFDAIAFIFQVRQPINII